MAKRKTWIDESGLEIPENRITPYEKIRERAAAKLLKKAGKINETLVAFKDEIEETCEKIWQAGHAEAGTDSERIAKLKGNHTWYNFDRTIKVEVSIQGRIDFDDILIASAKDQFDQYTEKLTATSSDAELICDLINVAFQTRNGKLDPKEVFKLFKYQSKVSAKKYPEFHKAIDLIGQSIRRPDSRKYTRISTQGEDGKYRVVDLNFSSI